MSYSESPIASSVSSPSTFNASDLQTRTATPMEEARHACRDIVSHTDLKMLPIWAERTSHGRWNGRTLSDWSNEGGGLPNGFHNLSSATGKYAAQGEPISIYASGIRFSAGIVEWLVRPKQEPRPSPRPCRDLDPSRYPYVGKVTSCRRCEVLERLSGP